MTEFSVKCPSKLLSNCAEGVYYDDSETDLGSNHVQGAIEAIVAGGVIGGGAQGPQGPQGPQGETGAQGDQGPQGPSGSTTTYGFNIGALGIKSIPHSTWTNVVLTTDDGTDVAGGYGSYSGSVPETGIYHVHGRALWLNSSGRNFARMRIINVTTNEPVTNDFSGTDISGRAMNVYSVMRISQNDSIELQIEQSSTTGSAEDISFYSFGMELLRNI